MISYRLWLGSYVALNLNHSVLCLESLQNSGSPFSSLPYPMWTMELIVSAGMLILGSSMG